MVDNLKEFLDVSSTSVPNTSDLLVEVASTSSTTQHIVNTMDISITSVSQDKKVELEYKGNVLDTWYAAPEEDLELSLVGSQFIETNNTYKMRITGTPGYALQPLYSSKGSKVELKSAAYYPSTEGPTPPTLEDITEAYAEQTTFSLQTSSAVDWAYVASYLGTPMVAFVSSSSVTGYNLGGTQVKVFTGFTSINKHKMATDGTYFYALPSVASTVFERIHIATDIRTNVTMISTTGPNTEGILEHHNGTLYSLIAPDSSNITKINTTTGVVGSITVFPPAVGTTCASAITTTPAGKTYLVWVTPSEIMYVDLSTEEVSRIITAAVPSVEEQKATVVAPGVVYVAHGEADILIDMGTSPPTILNNPGIFSDPGAASFVVYSATPSLSDIDDMSYSAYAKGVEVDNS